MHNSAAQMARRIPSNTEENGRLREIAAAFLRLASPIRRSGGAHRDDGAGVCAAEEVADAGRFCGPRGSGEFVARAEFDGVGDLSGRIAWRLAGLLIAGCSFILPSAVLVGILAWVYQKYGSAPQIGALLYGVKPVVVALIVQAVWSLGRVAVKSKELALLALVVLGLATTHVSAVALLIGTGVAWVVAERFAGRQANGKNRWRSFGAGQRGGSQHFTTECGRRVSFIF